MNDKNRKEYPMYRGLLRYFPDALAEVARVSQTGNRQHNDPNLPMHWDRKKSKDHGDCLMRHLTEAGKIDEDGMRHTAKVTWRALAMLQIELEEANQKRSCTKTIIAYESGKEKEAEEAIEYIRTHPNSTSVPLPEGLHLLQFDDGIPPALDLCEHEPIKQFDNANPKTRMIYVAGPMRGIKDLNFPAFDKARIKLKEEGYDVISPADLDRQHGLTNNKGYAKRDVAEILKCDAIYLLKGWEDSVGASAEFFLARWIGLDIICETGDHDPLHSFALRHCVP
jgi:Domain of unknown function (DUF4406)/Domain of unknown function (DUF5664)